MKHVRRLVLLMLGVMICCMLSMTAFASDYTVVSGDCLWRIANRTLGSGIRWTEIYEVNKQQIEDPHWIYPGQIFAIPDGLETAAEAVSAAPAEEVPEELVASAFLPLVGTPTDYADESSWIARPETEKVEDTLYFVGDCYYLSAPDDSAVCAVDSRSMRVAARADLAINKAAYTDTNVFAPYFRQAGVYNGETVDKEALLNEPRTDVYAALDYYFTHLNSGRAVQIVGRGQGAELLRIVLDDYLRANSDYVAYVTATMLE